MQVTNLSTMASPVFLSGRTIDEHSQFHSECHVSVPADPLQLPAPAHEDITPDLPIPHLTDLLKWEVTNPPHCAAGFATRCFLPEESISNLQSLPLSVLPDSSYSQPTSKPPPHPILPPAQRNSCLHRSHSMLALLLYLGSLGCSQGTGPQPSVTTECPQPQLHPGLKPTWPQEAGGCILSFITSCLSALPAHGLISLQPAQT